MRIFTHTLESKMPDQIATELRFIVASARASGKELILITLRADQDARIQASLQKNLKAIKKEGRIDFFAGKDAFTKSTAEASYLINKFPQITEIIETDDFILIIKI